MTENLWSSVWLTTHCRDVMWLETGHRRASSSSARRAGTFYSLPRAFRNDLGKTLSRGHALLFFPFQNKDESAFGSWGKPDEKTSCSRGKNSTGFELSTLYILGQENKRGRHLLPENSFTNAIPGHTPKGPIDAGNSSSLRLGKPTHV